MKRFEAYKFGTGPPRKLTMYVPCVWASIVVERVLHAAAETFRSAGLLRMDPRRNSTWNHEHVSSSDFVEATVHTAYDPAGHHKHRVSLGHDH